MSQEQKKRYWTFFLSAPNPRPSKTRTFYFYCRLGVSEISKNIRSVRQGNFRVVHSSVPERLLIGGVDSLVIVRILLVVTYRAKWRRRYHPPPLEKVQGATRIGATGLRASEREICL